jgi:hypothetical protein
VAEAYAMVFLVESGFAQQTDVARAFARSVRSVRELQITLAPLSSPHRTRAAQALCEEPARRGQPPVC